MYHAGLREGAELAQWVRLSKGALGRVVGVLGVCGRDILQLDRCGPCRVYASVRALRWGEPAEGRLGMDGQAGKWLALVERVTSMQYASLHAS
jgi:hypothetical protein